MANTKDPVLTPAMIEEWKRKTNPETGKKYTQSDIAKMFDVTRQYVSWVKHNKASTYSQTPRERVMENYPWNTGSRFHDASPNKRMRDHAEFIATGGEGMTKDKRQRLRWFYQYLTENDLVVEFDPDLPPMEGVKTGGFAFRPRVDSDADLMIRVNEHTEITFEGRMLWRLPEEWPSVR